MPLDDDWLLDGDEDPVLGVEVLAGWRSAMPMPAPVTPETSAIARPTAIASGAIRAGLEGGLDG